MSAAHMILRAMALALFTLLAGCSAAPGSLLLGDETRTLDRALVEAAAAPLIARGARVAVLTAVRGDETGADLSRRLEEAGLLAGGQVVPDALVLYVSYEPRYSELRAGARWSKGLPDTTLREIRTEALNPALRDERLGAGVTAALQSLERHLASPPLVERLMAALVYVVAAGLALTALAVSPLGARAGRWWRRSRPGRLAQGLGDRTPAGRRRLERIIRATRLRMEDRATYARSWCQAAVAGPKGGEAAPLMARLKALDQERAAVAAGSHQGRTLAEAMDRLAWAYEALGHEAARLAPPQPLRKSKRKKGAAGGDSFAAGAAATGSAMSSSSDDSSSTWDSAGASDSGPSSDGGSW